MANQSTVLSVVFHPDIDENNDTNENIDTSNSDDFKVIFDHLEIKIITGILYFCLIFFHNGYQVFIITSRLAILSSILKVVEHFVGQ